MTSAFCGFPVSAVWGKCDDNTSASGQSVVTVWGVNAQHNMLDGAAPRGTWDFFAQNSH